MNRMFAEIIYTRAGDMILKTPFVPGFVADLKTTVPGRYRVWEPREKVWLIDGYYADEVCELVDYYFPSAETIDLARIAITKRTPEPPWWAKILYIQPDAPREVVEAAYRALSKKYHPDRGGNEVSMKELNDAIDQARRAG